MGMAKCDDSWTVLSGVKTQFFTRGRKMVRLHYVSRLYRAAVLNLWAAHWWAADLCLQGRSHNFAVGGDDEILAN